MTELIALFLKPLPFFIHLAAVSVNLFEEESFLSEACLLSGFF